jgi:glycine dehydrogenase subunit 2
VTEKLPHSPRSAPVRGPRTLIFDVGAEESRCVEAPPLDVPMGAVDQLLGGRVRTTPLVLPNVTELEIMRHYEHLASMNFGVDSGMYPLGSCTMKYNPRINEDVCRLTGFSGLHPYQSEDSVQGALKLMVGLSDMLAEISGLPGVTLQPAAGAHGELTALMVFRAAHAARGDARKKVIIPDTAHGTNPASVTMCGWESITIPSNERGEVDLRALEVALDTDTAAFMLTNPSTIGLFDSQIVEIAEAVHAVGAYAYCDGANLNAILGKARPGDMGFDAMHINLHKTFSTPHGGGGPGSGPVCVSDELAPYLPGPLAVEFEDGRLGLGWPESTIGRVRSFYGNFGVLVRAYAYVCALGGEGLVEVAEQSVLSANYLKVLLESSFDVPFGRTCMHEFVMSGGRQKRQSGVRTLDMAKRLLDYGFHPPTVYFPMLVEEAMMIEPTETEPLEALDAFASVMLTIAEEASSNPDLVKGAPYTTPVRRLDEAGAARTPDLRYRRPGG